MKEIDIKKIRSAVAEIYDNCLPPESGRITSVLELSRITGLSPRLILQAVLGSEIFLNKPGYILTADPPPEKKRFKSKRYDKYKSQVLNETQRYARRKQFPDPGSKGRTTRVRYESRASNFQIENTGLNIIRSDVKDSTKSARPSKSASEKVPLPSAIIEYQKIVKNYDLWFQGDGMMRKFRLSNDLFPLSLNLQTQLTELQNIFYGSNGIFIGENQPAIVRLDLGVTQEEKLKIFELEGEKTNGFGYSACADLVRGKDSFLPGIPDVISRLINGKNIGLPLDQRFYFPEIIALARILRSEFGLNAWAISRDELKSLKFDTLLNWPSKWGNPPADISILIPDIPIYGDKTFLQQIGQLNPKVLAYLPKTETITSANIDYWEKTISDNPAGYVVKKAKSSGASGVALDFDTAIKFMLSARNTPAQYIVQERVEQALFPFAYVDPRGTKLEYDLMYTRFEAYLSKIGLASVLVTARPKLPVQGATDAIMISASSII